MADISRNHITIHGWMRTELGLKGNDLIIYALIYGFTQDGMSEFYGSHSYISQWTGMSDQGIANSISRLEEKGLIQKVVSIGKTNHYKTPPKKVVGTTQKSCVAPPKKVGGTTQKSWDNNNNNKHNNKNNNNCKPTKFSNFPERQYDMSALELLLLEADARALKKGES